MSRGFLVIIERAEGNFSAYSPDLPGCAATGDTVEETRKNMMNSIKLHLRGVEEDHATIAETRVVKAELVFA